MVETELVTYEEKNVQMSMLEVIGMIVIIFGVMYGIVLLNFYMALIISVVCKSSHFTLHVLYDYCNVCNRQEITVCIY